MSDTDTNATPVPGPTEASKSTKADAIGAKWGNDCKNTGWTAVPNILIHRQKTLGIDALDLNILLHLLTYWWQDEQMPYPSKQTIADAIGVSPSTVRKHIKGMEAGGLIRRIERRRENNRSDTNEYDLTPLKEKLAPHAAHELQERKKGREGRRKRKTTVTKPQVEEA